MTRICNILYFMGILRSFIKNVNCFNSKKMPRYIILEALSKYSTRIYTDMLYNISRRKNQTRHNLRWKRQGTDPT